MAASILDIDRKTLYNKMKLYNLSTKPTGKEKAMKDNVSSKTAPRCRRLPVDRDGHACRTVHIIRNLGLLQQ